MRGNSHVRCEAGEKSETLETVDLPIAIRDASFVKRGANSGIHGGDLEAFPKMGRDSERPHAECEGFFGINRVPKHRREQRFHLYA